MIIEEETGPCMTSGGRLTQIEKKTWLSRAKCKPTTTKTKTTTATTKKNLVV